MAFSLLSPSPGINYNFVAGAYLVCSLMLGVLFALDKVSLRTIGSSWVSPLTAHTTGLFELVEGCKALRLIIGRGIKLGNRISFALPRFFSLGSSEVRRERDPYYATERGIAGISRVFRFSPLVSGPGSFHSHVARTARL